MLSALELRVAIATRPWAMTPDALNRLAAIDVRSCPTQRAGIEARRTIASARAATRATPNGRVATISVLGTITQRPSFLELFGLGTSCDTIKTQLRSALADETVSRIVVDIDSPGGSVEGVAELATEIRSARNTKPIIGVANSMAASAAYWLGSACTELYATPSGLVGSIGVICSHQDISGALDQAGVKMTVIYAGQFKNEGSPFAPLTSEARRNTQSMINSYGADFDRAVALGRNVSVDTVRSKFGQGRMFRARDAAQLGMVDGVATMADVVRGKSKSDIRDGAYAGLPPTLAKAMRDLDAIE